MKWISGNKRKLRNIALVLLASSLLLIFAGCGGGGGEPLDSTPAIQTGLFLDSAVEGVNYTAMPSGLTGQTNEFGKFDYYKNDVVTFSIGDITLGSASGKRFLTPIDFEPAAANRDSYSQRVRNIVRLLQSMDMDDNPANGITLPPGIHERANGLSLDLSQDSIDFEQDPVVMILTGNLGLVQETDALDHFRATLLALSISNLQGGYTYVGGTVTDLQGNNIIPPGTILTGTMEISANGFVTQTFYVNGQLQIGGNGTLEIYDHNLLLVISSGCTYYLDYVYDVSQGLLTTTIDTSELAADGSQTLGACMGYPPGSGFIEIDIWKKGTSAQALAQSLIEPSSREDFIMGAGIGTGIE
jgi:hypothetical protein